MCNHYELTTFCGCDLRLNMQGGVYRYLTHHCQHRICCTGYCIAFATIMAISVLSHLASPCFIMRVFGYGLGERFKFLCAGGSYDIGLELSL